MVCCVAMLRAQALESAAKRFSKLEDAAHEVQLASDVHAVRTCWLRLKSVAACQLSGSMSV